MSNQIIELTGSDGHPILVNLQYLAFATRAVMQPQNGGGPPSVAIGVCALKMMDGTVLTVRSTIPELSKLMRENSPLLLESDDA